MPTEGRLYRTLGPADLPALLRLLAHAVPHDYLLPMARDWMMAGTTIGGWVRDDIVAVVRLDDMGEGEGWLGGIRVTPELRRQGIGRELMSHTLPVASAHGLKTIRMFIEEENAPSRALASSSGFRQGLTLAHLAGSLGRSTPLHRAFRLTSAPGKPVGEMRWIRAMGGFLSPTAREPFRLARASRARLQEETLSGHLYGVEGTQALFSLSPPLRVTWAGRAIRAFVPLDGSLEDAISGVSSVLGDEEVMLDCFLPLDGSAIGIAEGKGLVRGALWGRTIELYEAHIA